MSHLSSAGMRYYYYSPRLSRSSWRRSPSFSMRRWASWDCRARNSGYLRIPLSAFSYSGLGSERSGGSRMISDCGCLSATVGLDEPVHCSAADFDSSASSSSSCDGSSY